MIETAKNSEKQLINGKFLLKKIPGKGGWTYADIPCASFHRNTPFGWIKVKGSIDELEIKQYHLMPSGKNNLFLPINAEIRKKIKKQVGDIVHVILFYDNGPAKIPKEVLLCLQAEPQAFQFFNSLPDHEQSNYIKWIYSAKKDDTKIDRIVKMLSSLTKHEKWNPLNIALPR